MTPPSVLDSSLPFQKSQINKRHSRLSKSTTVSSHSPSFEAIKRTYNIGIEICEQLWNMASRPSLRIGFVPEHFSTPLHYAKKYFGLNAELIPFPSGTGHMITSLRSGEIDVGIGLTEGWVAGLGKEDVEGDGGYRIVGTYVETPLCTPASTIHSTPDV